MSCSKTVINLGQSSKFLYRIWNSVPNYEYNSELQLSTMVHIHYFSRAKCISRKLLRVNMIFHKTINIINNVEKFVIINFTRALCGVV